MVDVRVSKFQGQIVYSDRTTPVRVTRFAVQLLIPIASETRPTIVGGPQVFKPRIQRAMRVTRPGTDNREANPFRPTLPSEISAIDPRLYDYMREQVELLRQVHNKNQAGDSTFPWEIMTRLSDSKEFTLGSLGRFYHEDFGIILARYVQFSKWKAGDWLNGPCGRFKKSTKLSWVVTNDFLLSHSDAVVGIMASFVAPNEGQYGWVITQGANVVNLQIADLQAPTQYDQLVWTGFEQVGTSGVGRVIGRIETQKNTIDLNPGTVYLELEGPNLESIQALFSDDFLAINQALASYLDRIEALEGFAGSGGVNQTLSELQAELNALTRRVAQEESRRNSDVTGLKQRISELEDSLVTLADLDKLKLTITEEQKIITDSISAALVVAAEKAAAALAKANSIPVQQILDSITALGLQITALNARRYTMIPLVTGEVPPMLVHLDDGSLVFMEIES